jgi:exodeoxyribonuclease-1
MLQTYLFYDIETTGLNKCFDQVLQFAAIRTDLELKELERYEYRIKLNPDTIPSPYALITHNIPFTQLFDGLCEYEAIGKIHRLLNTPGTISIGYNTLGFDDEFLRFSFYRNLFTPYTHQYANACRRADLYPIAVMFFLYNRDVIKWPDINNKISLRLENLNNANQLVKGSAHDAMIDVEVTLALARIFMQSREMWEYLQTNFIKDADLERLQKLENAIFIDGIFGFENSYQVFACSLGLHNHYRNQFLWLRLDTPNLINTSVEKIPELYVIRKKAGEPAILLPPTKRFLDRFSQERLDLIAKNSEWLVSHPDMLNKIADYFKEYKYPVVENADVDSILYNQGFASDYEQLLCSQFHGLPLDKKGELLTKFKNPNLLAQAVRVLGRNYPEHLPKEYASNFADYLAKINPADENEALVDFQNQKRLTANKALREIDEILTNKTINEQQQKILREYREYLS